ncbi:MAG: hypothetical protein ACLSVD_13965 [Eggerthellaceae bacterium]
MGRVQRGARPRARGQLLRLGLRHAANGLRQRAACAGLAIVVVGIAIGRFAFYRFYLNVGLPRA